MKKFILLSLLFSVFVGLASAQACLPNGITFTTQAEVDNFRLNNPACTDIEGSVLIKGNNITNLDSLIPILTIAGNLIIEKTPLLVNLRGLDNLTHVGRHLMIKNNNGLKDLKGLEQLLTVAENVIVLKNEHLETFEGMDNIQSIGYNLIVSDNPRLITLHGLENLSKIGGDLQVLKNFLLPSIEKLSSLSEIGGSLIIGENEGLVSLIGLESITNINNHVVIYENALPNLVGLDFLRTIGGYLEIRDNQDLINLSGIETLLSVGVDVIITNNNQLQNLIGLELLTVIRRDLIIQENDAITSLNGLEGIIDVFGNLRILYNNQLKTLNGINKLNAVGGHLDIRGNDILIDLTGLEKLTAIEGDLSIKYNAALLNVNALINLKSIWGHLEIVWNNLLEGLEGLDNIDYKSITALQIEHNRKLSVCHVQSVCEYIQFKTPVAISDNDGGCNAVAEVESHCINNIISGTVFFDFNQNKVRDANEHGIPNMTVTVEPGNTTLLTNSRGVYAFYRGQIDTVYTLTWDPNPDWNLTSDSAAYHIVFNPANPRINNNDFGLFPDSTTHNVTGITTSKRTRCNFSVPFYTTVRNEGAFLEKGQIQINYDPLMTYVSSSILPTTIDVPNHLLTWDFDSLYPFETIDLVHDFVMPGVNNIGAQVSVETTILLDSAGQLMHHATHKYSSSIVCSYDPNDKSVSPVGEKEANFILRDQAMYYTVRFQNTGNIEALDVRIEDQLSEYLDWSTLKVIRTSHPVQTSIDDYGKVTFLFKDILLPDSTSDYDGSQGMVLYEIWPVADVPDFTIINNTAHIIFDLNPAIITNTTYTTLVEKLPTTTDNSDVMEDHTFNIYPNPMTNEFKLNWRGKTQVEGLRLIDHLGRTVREFNNLDNEIYNVGSVNKGSYILEVKWEDNTRSRRSIVIMK